MLPWDNAARYGSRAIVHTNVEGDGYKTWLSQALIDTYKRYPPEERIVFLHSWNEWCEGTYLEPDGKYGRHFLEQTREAIGDVRSAIKAQVASRSDVDVWMLLSRIQREKDVGAFRALSAARMEARYTHIELHRVRREAELERVRREAELERERREAELERVRREAELERERRQPPGELRKFSPADDKLTIEALKSLIAITKVKRFFLLPFKNKARHQTAVLRELRSIVSSMKDRQSLDA